MPFVLVFFSMQLSIFVSPCESRLFFAVFLKEKPCCHSRQLLYDNKCRIICQAKFKKFFIFFRFFVKISAIVTVLQNVTAFNKKNTASPAEHTGKSGNLYFLYALTQLIHNLFEEIGALFKLGKVAVVAAVSLDNHTAVEARAL